MNNTLAIEYVYGMIISYLITAGLWILITINNVLIGNKFSSSGLLYSAGFVLYAWRNYRFYICQGGVVTNDLFYTGFMVSALFLIGALQILVYQWYSKNKM